MYFYSPEWEVALEEAQIQASWKLRDWSSLKKQLKECYSPSLSSNPVISPTSSSIQSVSIPGSTYSNNNNPSGESWNVSILRILCQLHDTELDGALRELKETRLKLMSPIVAAASDTANGYSRSYLNVVQLHILSEVEEVVGLMEEHRENQSPNSSILLARTRDKLKGILQRWEVRLNVMLKSQKVMDPVLNVRKVCLSINPRKKLSFKLV
jgi:hypothetical protein